MIRGWVAWDSLKYNYRRSRFWFFRLEKQKQQQQLNGLREHISEIFGIAGAHISSLASPVFGTSAKNVEKFRKRPNASERFRTYPNASECIRVGPNRSQHVSEPTKTSKSFAKTSQKLRETRASAVVVCTGACCQGVSADPTTNEIHDDLRGGRIS